jgi:histidyl-tRNA synthetase
MSSSPLIRPLRGFSDVVGHSHLRATQTFFDIASLHGFTPVHTPLVEPRSLFVHLGDQSDVVQKELFDVSPSDPAAVLRPEGTAGVVRAAFALGLVPAPGAGALRLAYAGPMFRRERPQRGRLRQFTQLGVEVLGPPAPEVDAEVIAMGRDVLQACGLAEGQQFRLEVNTLGDAESRASYEAALRAHLVGQPLSADSAARLSRGNVLRILDSKDEADGPALASAPPLSAHLSDDAKRRFDRVLFLLSGLQVPYTVNERLVRGLDYYTGTAFEFTSVARGEARQSALLAGGRYDGLVHAMGGGAVSVGGIGWAAGLERILLEQRQGVATEQSPLVRIVPVFEGCDPETAAKVSQACILAARALRARGTPASTEHPPVSQKVKKFLSKLPATDRVCCIGESELKAKSAKINNSSDSITW